MINTLHVSDRILMVVLNTIPTTILIQVYMPTSTHKDEEVEVIYEQLDELLCSVKAEDNLFIMGDFNAVVGEEKDGSVTGKWGLGNRNERGERMINFCKQYDLCVTNTMFEMPKRRIYTWKMPGDIARYQLDYILTRANSKKRISSSHAYPGPNVDSDHNLVMAKCEIEWRKIPKKLVKKICSIDIEKLKDPEFRNKYEKETDREGKEVTRKEMDREGKEITVAATSALNKWKSIKEKVEKSATITLGKTKRKPRKNWITQEIMDLILLRNQYRNDTTEEGQKMYKRYKNRVQTLCIQHKENWVDAQCNKIDFYMKKGMLDKGYSTVKKLQQKKSTNSKIIKNKEGKLL